MKMFSIYWFPDREFMADIVGIQEDKERSSKGSDGDLLMWKFLPQEKPSTSELIDWLKL